MVVGSATSDAEKAGPSTGLLRSLSIGCRELSQSPRRLLVLTDRRPFAAVGGLSVFVSHRHPSPTRKVHVDDKAHSIFSSTFARDQRPEVIRT